MARSSPLVSNVDFHSAIEAPMLFGIASVYRLAPAKTARWLQLGRVALNYQPIVNGPGAIFREVLTSRVCPFGRVSVTVHPNMHRGKVLEKRDSLLKF